MPDQPITELYKIQISLTEWFEKIGHADVEALRQEDNTKRDRLAVLKKHVGVPYDVPTRFSARHIVDREAAFQEYLATHGHELCAMRLLPQEPGLSKLRMRGHTVSHAVHVWFPEQRVDPDKYLVEFMPHPSMHYWSTIFVVNGHGIFGEIIAESHQYLTQGFYTDIKPIKFSFDFETWDLAPKNEEAKAYLKTLVTYLSVEDPAIRQMLMNQVGATFSNTYLNGYFESVHSEFGTWFNDYSQRLGELYKDFSIDADRFEKISQNMIRGMIASPGIARGRVHIVSDPSRVTLEPDEVLVCDMTSPHYVGLMQQACAIVTDRGGMLCHAAIIARELKKPCIVGTGSATTVLQDRDTVEVDGGKGVVKRI